MDPFFKSHKDFDIKDIIEIFSLLTWWPSLVPSACIAPRWWAVAGVGFCTGAPQSVWTGTRFHRHSQSLGLSGLPLLETKK